MHFNGRFILNVAEFASQQGADFEHLISLSGLDVNTLSDAECRVSSDVYNAVLSEALTMTEDSLLGLHMGQYLNLSAAGLVLQIAQTSDTVLQAMEYSCSFSNLLCNALPLSLTELPDHYRISMAPHALWQKECPECVKQTIYGHLIFSIREFQALTDQTYLPKYISLAFDPPQKKAELEKVLKCRVQYRASETALFFYKHHFNQKIRTGDYKLLKILVAHAQARSDALQHGQLFYEKVQQSIVRLVQPAFPSLQQVAQHLNMSVRTFQRKLSAEGYSFKQIIDGLRMDFAIRYLKDPSLTINEIAFLLDYSSASTFVRSFRRWYNQTPGDYRQNET